MSLQTRKRDSNPKVTRKRDSNPKVTYSTNQLQLFDTHCHPQLIKDHIDLSYFTNDVSRVLAVSVSCADRFDLMNLADQHSGLYYSVGSHPLDTSDSHILDIANDPTLYHSKLVAIGETGLDYYPGIQMDDIRRQQQSFEGHLWLSQQLSKPIIIHTRYDVEDDLILTIEQYSNVCGVLHSFCGPYSLAKRALDLGYYISLSGIVTFKSAQHVRDIAHYVPLDRLLIETDAPYLCPHPFRGYTNHPSYLHITAKFVASLLSITYEELADTTTANACRLFSI